MTCSAITPSGKVASAAKCDVDAGDGIAGQHAEAVEPEEQGNDILDQSGRVLARNGVECRNNWHQGGVECIDLFATVSEREENES